MAEERTVCHTPTAGKNPTSIPTWKYEAVRKAILKAVPKKAPGMMAKDLPDRVAELLSDSLRERLGSVAWHTTSVKLHMETLGELRRDPKLKPQHIVRRR